jgi:hypothetical protein
MISGIVNAGATEPAVSESLMDTTPFYEFLTQLFDQGKIVFRSAIAPRDQPSPVAMKTLADAFENHSLAVAGPRIRFDPEIACAAAEFLRQASWALVNHDERMKDLEKRLMMPRSPSTSSEHLSADLTLRYLPQVLRRARGLDPSDPLVERIANTLRRWPLSGVLSDVTEAPTGPLEFGGHTGLLLLYAERLGNNDRPAWRPARSSAAYDYHELISQDTHKGNS